MARLTIEPLRTDHLPDAAQLVAARYAAMRRAAPALPPRYADPAEWLPRLQRLAGRAPGAAALAGGRLVGFLVAFLLDRFRGRRGVYSPEWANAAAPGLAGEVYPALYAELCAAWLAAGHTAHGVGLFADEAEASEALRWLGFGLAAADAVRYLEPAPPPVSLPGLAIRRAGPDDLAQLAELDAALHQHLMDPPVCLPLAPLVGHDDLAAELADPAFAFWSAWAGDEAVAFMKFGPASQNASAVIFDPGTTSITGAFTRPALRGRGVGAALLARGLDWAREAGYTRCSVDFEPMNTPAARFWLDHFRLVCLGHLRLIDPPPARA